MKHLSFLRRHANIVFCLLLCLVYQRAESKELFENNSLDTCYVLAIANVDLTTDLQKKYEERNIATSAIVGYSFSDDEVKIYLLDDRWKNRGGVTPEAEGRLTTENFLILTPKVSCPTGSFLFQRITSWRP